MRTERSDQIDGRGGIEAMETSPLTTTSQAAASGPLLLADIGGYTSFLHSVADAHRDDAFADGAVPDAYSLMSSLLDGIVEHIAPPFTLSKIEGDAVFAFATSRTEIPSGRGVIDCIRECYADFQERLGRAGETWTCSCDACSRVSGLDLKFVLHFGSYVIQQIAGSRELIGSDVVLAHRLLKSDAARVVGRSAYAVLTTAAVAGLDLDPDGALPMTAAYEHYRPMETLVLPLP